jgi:biotin synthase-like enzyme
MGEKLLTTPNPGQDRDQQLLGKLGMRLREQPAAAAETAVSLVPSAQ